MPVAVAHPPPSASPTLLLADTHTQLFDYLTSHKLKHQRDSWSTLVVFGSANQHSSQFNSIHRISPRGVSGTLTAPSHLSRWSNTSRQTFRVAIRMGPGISFTSPSALLVPLRVHPQLRASSSWLPLLRSFARRESEIVLSLVDFLGSRHRPANIVPTSRAVVHNGSRALDPDAYQS